MFVEEEHSIFMEMSERLYCFLHLFLLFWPGIYLKACQWCPCSYFKSYNQAVQPENGDLLLHPKDRTLLK